MPVLAAEPFVSPDDLLTASFLPEATSARWWVLHTRPRAEKALARRFRRVGLSYFLPVYEQKRRLQRRQICSQLPLFPGYLFLHGDEDARRAAFDTRLVAGSLRVENQARFAEDLSRIYSLIESGAPLFPEEKLREGMRAQIRSGPLEGLEGTVVRRGKTLKFVIEVNFLQQGASVEVDASMIQPI